MLDLQNTLLTNCMLIFLVPAVFAILIFVLGRISWVFREGLSLIGIILTFLLSLRIYYAVPQMAAKEITAWNNQFRMDSLSSLVCLLIALLGLIVIVYSFRYMSQEVSKGLIQKERLSSYYGWIMLFISTMLWATSTNNIIMLYVIIEGTTLASGILVAFYWNKEALEAGYKYLMLLTVGITFALFGAILLYSGASPFVKGVDPLQITEIAKVASKIPKSIVLLSVAFLLVGFGTKAGIAPFHAWLPDAHAEAPTPVSVLLSGVMIKVGAYALIRCITIFYPLYSGISLFVVILGVFTMIVGVFMMFTQEDLKRFLAYCSVSAMGYIIMGLGFGNYLGIYGSIFHILNHALIKALLFLCVGAVMYRTGARKVGELGGLGKKMPLTAFCFFVGALAISGIPLLNGFMSEFTLFIAGAKCGMLWATIIAIVVSILTLACFIHIAYRVFMGEEGEKVKGEIKEVPFSMWVGIFVLTGLCFIIGIYPQCVYPILDRATEGVLALMAVR